jgi:hypothetical protein
MANQSPQMMMTTPPYSQSMHAQNPSSQAPMRGMSPPSAQRGAKPTYVTGAAGSLSGTQSYNYPQSSGMWPQTPQTPQHGAYSGYTTQAQTPHAQQSPAPQIRHSSSGQMQPGTMQFSGMPGMAQGYAGGQAIYPTEQTPRQYLPQGAQAAPPVTQAWSGQPTPAQQWWTNQQQ